jgi:chromosome segregation ATPase
VFPKNDVQKVERSLRDAENRLGENRAKIDVLVRELQTMQVLQQTLEENLRNLRQKGIIALVMEFRKARLDLARTKNKITQIDWDLAIVRSVLEENTRLVSDYQKLFDQLMANSGKNVLHGKFPKKP